MTKEQESKNYRALSKLEAAYQYCCEKDGETSKACRVLSRVLDKVIIQTPLDEVEKWYFGGIARSVRYEVRQETREIIERGRHLQTCNFCPY